MTSLERTALFPAKGLVWIELSCERRCVLTMLTEDPAEFFTMIFGGDAFMDWYAYTPSFIHKRRVALYLGPNTCAGSARSRL
jgi:hypothetical protein